MNRVQRRRGPRRRRQSPAAGGARGQGRRGRRVALGLGAVLRRQGQVATLLLLLLLGVLGHLGPGLLAFRLLLLLPARVFRVRALVGGLRVVRWLGVRGGCRVGLECRGLKRWCRLLWVFFRRFCSYGLGGDVMQRKRMNFCIQSILDFVKLRGGFKLSFYHWLVKVMNNFEKPLSNFLFL